jgi:hypothetical protein
LRTCSGNMTASASPRRARGAGEQQGPAPISDIVIYITDSSSDSEGPAHQPAAAAATAEATRLPAWPPAPAPAVALEDGQSRSCVSGGTHSLRSFRSTPRSARGVSLRKQTPSPRAKWRAGGATAGCVWECPCAALVSEGRRDAGWALSPVQSGAGPRPVPGNACSWVRPEAPRSLAAAAAADVGCCVTLDSDDDEHSLTPGAASPRSAAAACPH